LHVRNFEAPGGAAVYMLADEPEATDYMIIGDTVYPVNPTTSKAYQRQLERYVTIAERRG